MVTGSSWTTAATLGVGWIVVVLMVLVLIGLIAYARGDEHHRGDDFGALSVAVLRSGEL